MECYSLSFENSPISILCFSVSHAFTKLQTQSHDFLKQLENLWCVQVFYFKLS